MLENNFLNILLTSLLEAMLILLMSIFLFRRFMIGLTGELETAQSNSFFAVTGLLFSQSLIIAVFYCQYIVQLRELFAPGYFYCYFAVVNIVLPAFTIMVMKQLAVQMNHALESKTKLAALGKIKDLLLAMREQRHNFRHELQVVYGLLEVQEFQAAQDYLKQSVSEVTAASELVKTDNLEISALLYAKTGLANARSIDLRITVETSLRQLGMETRDINLVLGNLIDNAFEAAVEAPIPQRKVEVALMQDTKNYIFEVTNTGTAILPDMHAKLFQAGFSTKGEERSLGLYSINKLVSKYHGNIQVTSNNGGTCFRVMIPAKASRTASGAEITAGCKRKTVHTVPGTADNKNYPF